MSPDLANTAVIVTGAARGMGRAMTLALAKAGVRVAAADLAAAKAEMDEMLATARAQGCADRIAPVDCDVTNPDDCVRLVKWAQQRFGAVHGLVNNAGIRVLDADLETGGRARKFYQHDVQTWQRVITTNVIGPFHMAKAITPALVAQGFGRIVNITTSHATMVGEAFSPYGPSKAALEAATVIWAKDLAATGVTVNVLLPGGAGNTRIIPVADVTDRSTLVQPEVMMAPIVWLMSRQSDGITGRRFIARLWDPALDPAKAAEQAGAPAGWGT